MKQMNESALFSSPKNQSVTLNDIACYVLEGNNSSVT